MSLNQLVQQRLRDKGPVRVGLIGAGKFGSMFLSQGADHRGVAVSVIADLDSQRARDVCAAVGWEPERITRTRFVEGGEALIAADDVDVVVEATGHPPAGVTHARQAMREGKDIVMVIRRGGRAGGAIAGARSGVGRHRLLDGLRRPAGPDLRARGLGPPVRLRGGGGGEGHPVLAGLSRLDAATVWDYYGLTAAQAERRA